MGKARCINERYDFVLLNESIVVKDNQIRIGYVFDKDTQKPVLMLDVVNGLYKERHQTFGIVGDLINDKDGSSAGLVLVDKDISYLYFVSTKYGYVYLMHELCHFYNGDYDASNINYSQERKKLLKQGIVHPKEYLADEFAVRECGLQKFLDSMDWLKAVRKHVFHKTSKENLELALFEYDKRIEHAIEYAKVIGIN